MNHAVFLSQAAPLGLPIGRPFIKMHGLRNYFVIFDRRHDPFELSADDIVRICDTNVGVGGEQVLTIETPSPEARSAGAYAAMRIFNIDGREVSACGNATRCMAHLLLDESGHDQLLLETGAGILTCRKAGPMEVSVKLGPISMDWRDIPMAGPVDTSHLPLSSGPLSDGIALAIGNPHATFFVDQLSSIDLRAVAPSIQNDPLFPEGVNVGVAEIVNRSNLRLAVWERPGILTEACGTGACVSVYAARLRGLVDPGTVTVHLPAGTIDIEINDDDSVIMTGPVAFCCHGFV